MVLVRFRPGDRAATLRSLQRDYSAEMLSDNVPARIANLHRVRYLPIVGAVIAAAFGTVLLGYTLAVGVRARRRELGVLRAMGMAPGRLVRVLGFQGVMLALTMLVIGVPLGFLVG